MEKQLIWVLFYVVRLLKYKLNWNWQGSEAVIPEVNTIPSRWAFSWLPRNIISFMAIYIGFKHNCLIENSASDQEFESKADLRRIPNYRPNFLSSVKT